MTLENFKENDIKAEQNMEVAGQLTVSRVIEFIGADLDILREFWRIRKDKKVQPLDLRTFIGKLDALIEFWQRLQILNGDPKSKNENCMKCLLRNHGKDKERKNREKT